MIQELRNSLAISPVVFYDREHRYFLGDRELSGVTSCLSRQIFKAKYDAIPEDVLQAAAERGHNVHQDIQNMDELGCIPETTEATDYANMMYAAGWRNVANEYLVNTEHHASMIDLVLVNNNGEIILADIKTTSKLDREYVAWQLSVYAYMFELMNPTLKVSRLAAVWLPKPQYGTPQLFDLTGARIPEWEVEELLRADAAGETYHMPEALTDTALVSNDALPTQYAELEAELLAAITLIKETEEHKKRLVAGLETVMRENGVKKWQTDRIILTIKADTTTERLDTKRLKEEQPEIYAQYIKTSPVKGGLLIKTR